MPDTQNVEVDENGFLTEPESWSRQKAEILAEQHGSGPLTDAHWEIIQALRDYYSEHKVPPALSNVCWSHEMDKACLPDLFGNSRIAWIIAGLPDPGEEAKSYMSDW